MFAIICELILLKVYYAWATILFSLHASLRELSVQPEGDISLTCRQLLQQSAWLEGKISMSRVF